MFDIKISLKPGSRAWVCDRFHRKHHEKYNECVDPNAQYGPVYEQGIRCKKCGRKWDDPEIAERRRQEELRERARHYHLYFGTVDQEILTLYGEWGDVDRFVSQYNDIRKMYREYSQEEWMNPPGPMHIDQKEIGLIEDKWFVFDEDCDSCDVKIELDGRTHEYQREIDLLSNWPCLKTPMHPEGKKVWDRR